MSVEKDLKALDLCRAGVAISVIRENLGFKTVQSTVAAIARARKAQGHAVEAATVREVELDRLNRLQQAVWAKALRGDEKAVELAVSLSRERVRLSGVPVRSRMGGAVEATLKCVSLRDVDEAAAETARRIAASIDAAADTGDRTVEMKALYLVPHLMNVLRELGATPEARGEVAKAAVPAVVEGDDELAKFRRRKAAKPG
ncbi:hypothetical protein [Leucobacter sp. OH1287]|uniref:terminase small subunit n=1 Tax=Leucobacter sp. OH1287 TaxID=2491049 RepID=UPI000F5F7D3C|nr:hypothetical protein [Leucobacter sp. OH1287]RRD61641.1 hypothetical protein EII30_02095 [Leucobacter sp. OH1287]